MLEEGRDALAADGVAHGRRRCRSVQAQDEVKGGEGVEGGGWGDKQPLGGI